MPASMAFFRLPADHAVDHLVDLLDQAFPNTIPSNPTTENLLKRAGNREVVDFLRSLQKQRDDDIAKD
ncbi:MAG: hypothetical protein INH37_14820 [Myxococcaceae bacterium]|nr:hypothetical protein [Myxococcaceae bacterium]